MNIHKHNTLKDFDKYLMADMEYDVRFIQAFFLVKLLFDEQ